MNPISFEERETLFKEAISECDSFLKSKEYDKAFKSVAKANLLLGTYAANLSDTYELGRYLQNLIKIKDRQADICIKENNPKYDYFLINYLESDALWIANDLICFPHLSGFFHRKKIQFSPYSDDFGSDSLEISPDEDTDVYISLKKLKIFQWRKDILKEYLDFIYNELPIIYGVPSDFNEGTLSEALHKWSINETHVLISLLPEELNKKAIGTLPYEINKFVTKLLRKYYDMGNP